MFKQPAKVLSLLAEYGNALICDNQDTSGGRMRGAVGKSVENRSRG